MPPPHDDFDRALARALALQRLATEAWDQLDRTSGARQREVRPAPTGFPTALTPRETEVITLMGTGMPNRSIARNLRISERTVKSHLHSIFTKLGVTTRGEAVAKLNGTPSLDFSCVRCPCGRCTAACHQAADRPR